MPTVLRAAGLAVRIYSDDHEPRHVHVVKAGAEVRIGLGSDREAPSLWTNRGMDLETARQALAPVEANQTAVLDAWEVIHGA